MSVAIHKVGGRLGTKLGLLTPMACEIIHISQRIEIKSLRTEELPKLPQEPVLLNL